MKRMLIKAVERIKYIKHQYDSCHIAAYSAQAAFFMLVSAVPMAMFAVVLIGALVPFDIMGLHRLMAEIFAENISGQLSEMVTEIVDHSTIPLASVTMVFLLWAATRGIRSIADGIDVIYNHREEYGFVQRAVRSVCYALVIVAVFVLSFGVLVLAEPLENMVHSLLGGWADLVMLLFNMRNIIFFFALTLLFATAYRALARSELGFRKQLLGASFAAAGWIVYSFGYSVYIRHFSRYSALYGSFGAVMLFLLWLYMCMNILLCGALLNKLTFAEGEEKQKD